MPTNDFIGFASSGSANIASQADYAAAAEHGIGMQPGPASSKLANKAWRQGANMAAVIGELIKNHGNDALDNGDLVTLYNALLLSTASTTLAGLMSATDKTALDTLLAYDSTSHVVTPDDTIVASGASFEYRNLGAFTLLTGNAKFLTATPTFGGRRVAYDVPTPVWPEQLKAIIYCDNSTYYGAWVAISGGGGVYINTRAVSIPANLLFYICVLYPRVL